MKLLVDMNLPPLLADMLDVECFEPEHWHRIGAKNATDSEIMKYAQQHGYVVITCDLDFSAILSVTQGNKPSIVQVRARNMPWKDMADIIIKSIKQNVSDLNAGAILTINIKKSRTRLLPL